MMEEMEKSEISEESEENSKSFVLVEFESSGSALFHLTMDNIVPMQLLAVASFLEYKGKSLMQAQEYQQAMEQRAIQEKLSNQIAVPGH